MTIFISLITLVQCYANQGNVHRYYYKETGENIDGSANVRDCINGKILFSLDDSIFVECSNEFNGWYSVGVNVRLDSIQCKSMKFHKGDTLFNFFGEKVGVVHSETSVIFPQKGDGIETGCIKGYTIKNNIRPESIIENVLSEVINKNEGNITLDDLNLLIRSFQMHPCSSTSMGNNKGEWFYYEESLIEDISPRDRITLIIENKILVGIVHSRKIDFESHKTYELIRGHKFTPIAELSDEKIEKMIKERINWYNSID